MSQHNVQICLRQMRDHAREAIALTSGKTKKDLDADRVLNLALVRLLEVIGEAANRVPPEERARYPQIPWPQIIGLRNRLIHGYDQVDLDIVWEIVKHHLAALVRQLDGIVGAG